MSNLVSRQAAIDAVSSGIIKEKDDAYWLVESPYECNSMIEWAVEVLKELPSAQPEQRWIPVDLQNNSPEENKVVLLGVRFRNNFKYFVTSRQDYNYWTGLGREIKGELRWQPLPESYSGE